MPKKKKSAMSSDWKYIPHSGGMVSAATRTRVGRARACGAASHGRWCRSAARLNGRLAAGRRCKT